MSENTQTESTSSEPVGNSNVIETNENSSRKEMPKVVAATENREFIDAITGGLMQFVKPLQDGIAQSRDAAERARAVILESEEKERSLLEKMNSVLHTMENAFQEVRSQFSGKVRQSRQKPQHVGSGTGRRGRPRKTPVSRSENPNTPSEKQPSRGKRQTTRSILLDYLQKHKEAYVGDLQAACEQHGKTSPVSMVLSKMVDKGDIVRIKQGHYSINN